MTTRVFVEPDGLRAGAEFPLSPDESHYVLRVRRLAPGDALEALDGTGRVFVGTVARADGKACVVQIGSPIERAPGPARVVLLGRPDPRAALEALTAASEAGATHVVLLRTAFAHHAVPSPARIDRTLRASQRQCGRPLAPRVEIGEDLAATLSRDWPPPAFVAEPCATEAPPVLDARAGATVLIGPEGGLTADELARARAAGFAPLSLSPWILRTQTAVAAALGRLYGTPPA